MTETKPSSGSMPSQIVNVHNSLFAAIQFSKKQQWAITNYVILVYAAIFGLSKGLDNLTVTERRGFTALILVAGAFAVFLLISIQADLGTYREQLEKIHNRWISDEDRKEYKGKSIRERV